jgi:hypothetical protein
MFTSAVVSIVGRNTIFRKAPTSVVSGYGERSIKLNKVKCPEIVNMDFYFVGITF